MPKKSTDELKRLVEQAKSKIERHSILVGLADRRLDKWRLKLAEAKREVRRSTGKPKKRALWKGRVERDKRKVALWKRRKHDAIYLVHNWQNALADLLRALARRKTDGRKLVRWAKGYLGVREGSAQQVKWANDLGYSSALPWCSIFVANGIRESYRLSLPANPAYSGAWLAWKHGKRVSIDKRRPGDILIYDWGDGGITDHVAIYEGNGRRIGGNQSDAVTEADVDAEFLVAVVRPRRKK